jgi:hypothetical protein
MFSRDKKHTDSADGETEIRLDVLQQFRFIQRQAFRSEHFEHGASVGLEIIFEYPKRMLGGLGIKFRESGIDSVSASHFDLIKLN